MFLTACALKKLPLIVFSAYYCCWIITIMLILSFHVPLVALQYEFVICMNLYFQLFV